MRTERTPITLLSGFLGSGKTTLLRRWRLHPSLRDAALIVHDFSAFGLDAELLAEEEPPPEPGRLTGRVAALHGPFASERLHASVAEALDSIASLDPPAPHVVCESTGAARPWPLLEALTQDDRFQLRHAIVVVDSLNLHRDYADGRALVGEVALSSDPARRSAAEILAEQILFASVLVLTKVDAVPEDAVQIQIAALQRLRPRVPVGLSTYGGLGLHQLDHVPAPDRAELQGWAERFGMLDRRPTPSDMTALVLRDPRPFHPRRLYDACQRDLGTGVFRTKGFVWLASRPEHILLWQQSGSQISLEIRGFWGAEAIRDPAAGLLPEEAAHLAAKLDAQHPVFGDRRNELTVLGDDASCHTFFRALQHALCTPAEVAAWQAGEAFDDPWPTSLKQLDLA